MTKTGRKVSRGDQAVLKSFGKRVAAIRVKKGLTVYDLTGSDMAIKSRQHWQRIEAGQKNINITTLFKVANTLDVDANELLAGIRH